MATARRAAAGRRTWAGALGGAGRAELPDGISFEDGLTAVVRKFVDRLTQEAPAEQSVKLLTTALLLSGLRVDRNVALGIFQGIPMLEESDTYLMILERGEERAMRKAILLAGEARLGAANESIKNRLAEVKDAERLARMVEKAAIVSSWEEIIEDVDIDATGTSSQ